MTFLSIAFKFVLGGLGRLWDAVMWLVKWCLEHPSEAMAIAGFISSIWFWNAKEDAEDLAAENKADFLEEKAAHQGTEANYRKAALKREQNDRDNVERVRAESERLAAKEREKYEIRIADYDSRANRLLGQLRAIKTDPGGTPGEELPGDPNATCRTLGAANCENLVARMKDGQRSIDKLIGLQAFYAGTQALDTNGNTSSERPN